MADTTSVLAKKTKQQLIDDYIDLTQKLADLDKSTIPYEKAESPKKENLKQSELKTEDVFENINKLKLNVSRFLTQLYEDNLHELESLEKYRQQVLDAKKDLEIIYKIKAEATTLQNLVQIKNDFESDFYRQKERFLADWEDEKKKTKKLWDDEKHDLEQLRKRDQEEYNYDQKQKRLKEESEFSKKIEEKEKTISDKELLLKNREAEYEQLKTTVAQFDGILTQEIEKVRKQVSDETKRDLEQKYNIQMAEIAGEKKVSEITIQNLEKTIKAQESEIKQLKAQMEDSTRQIKEIAVSVIEKDRPQPRIETGKDEK
ncbi:MAG: hypothetical protein WCJ19_03380 [bacterium]